MVEVGCRTRAKHASKEEAAINVDWLKEEIAAGIRDHRREWAGSSVPGRDLPETIAERVQRRLVKELDAYEKRIKKTVDHAFDKEREVVP